MMLSDFIVVVFMPGNFEGKMGKHCNNSNNLISCKWISAVLHPWSVDEVDRDLSSVLHITYRMYMWIRIFLATVTSNIHLYMYKSIPKLNSPGCCMLLIECSVSCLWETGGRW